jgi:acetyl-CoA carboxylase biotin carboxylase subunit
MVPPQYDSLLAKLIVHGKDRAEALQLMRRALANAKIAGVATNLPLHSELMRDDEFSRGGVSTAFLQQFLQSRSMEAA